MSKIKRIINYMQAENENGLPGAFALLDDTRKRYAKYLVARYRYPVRIALQTAYINGYDIWPYDYRTRGLVHEGTPREAFGIW